MFYVRVDRSVILSHGIVFLNGDRSGYFANLTYVTIILHSVCPNKKTGRT